VVDPSAAMPARTRDQESDAAAAPWRGSSGCTHACTGGATPRVQAMLLASATPHAGSDTTLPAQETLLAPATRHARTGATLPVHATLLAPATLRDRSGAALPPDPDPLPGRMAARWTRVDRKCPGRAGQCAPPVPPAHCPTERRRRPHPCAATSYGRPDAPRFPGTPRDPCTHAARRAGPARRRRWTRVATARPGCIPAGSRTSPDRPHRRRVEP
jgi:hypothetical protein